MENSSKETFLQLPPRYCLHHVCAFFLKSKEISFEMLAMRKTKRRVSRAKNTADWLSTQRLCPEHVTLHYRPLSGTNCLTSRPRKFGNEWRHRTNGLSLQTLEEGEETLEVSDLFLAGFLKKIGPQCVLVVLCLCLFHSAGCQYLGVELPQMRRKTSRYNF